jgi:hypothetical protein
VARELETRWNNALEQVQQIEVRLAELAVASASRPGIDRDALMALEPRRPQPKARRPVARAFRRGARAWQLLRRRGRSRTDRALRRSPPG